MRLEALLVNPLKAGPLLPPHASHTAHVGHQVSGGHQKIGKERLYEKMKAKTNPNGHLFQCYVSNRH